MDAHSLIRLLGERAGTNLELNEDQTLNLQFDNGQIFSMKYDEENKFLYCYIKVAELPAEETARQAIFKKLLSANLFTNETNGATFGIDEVFNEIILSRRLELEYTDLALLLANIESMVRLSQEWDQQLNKATYIQTLPEVNMDNMYHQFKA